jgi:hypothetical protein
VLTRADLRRQRAIVQILAQLRKQDVDAGGRCGAVGSGALYQPGGLLYLKAGSGVEL